MPPLSDTIEAFIKTMLGPSLSEIELKRNELAEQFSCAPSQITYVLSTRFTPDHGYLTESRRGGGGYIRVIRIMGDSGERLAELMCEEAADAISENRALAIIAGLTEQGIASAEDAQLMRAATCACTAALPADIKDQIRAMTLRNMLAALAQRK